MIGQVPRSADVAPIAADAPVCGLSRSPSTGWAADSAAEFGVRRSLDLAAVATADSGPTQSTSTAAAPSATDNKDAHDGGYGSAVSNRAR